METSYFGNLSRLKNKKVISIARGTPKWFNGSQYLKLAPTWEMIKHMSEEEYIFSYKNLLKKLNPKEVYKELGEETVLLCWERPGDFCHRRLVAEWFENELGLLVPEYVFKKEKGDRIRKNNILKDNQISLF